MEHKPGRVVLSRVQRILVAIVITGALVIAAIGFSGSYAAVRDLADRTGAQLALDGTNRTDWTSALLIT